MAKKKHRDIEVDGVRYAWMVKGHMKDSVLIIWKDKKIIISENIRMSMKPSIVAEMIKEFVK